MKQTGQQRRRIVGRMDRSRPEVQPAVGNAARAWPTPKGALDSASDDKTPASRNTSFDSKTTSAHVEPQASGRVQEFWKELVHAVGPNFSGNLVLHCAHGTVMKYEVHQVLRPKGGPVVVEGPLDASVDDIVECSE